jgi:hypothetical protein
VADFPDKDIVVDDVGNGRHVVGKGGEFVPEEDSEDESGEESFENKSESEEDEERNKKRFKKKQHESDDDIDSDHSIREKQSVGSKSVERRKQTFERQLLRRASSGSAGKSESVVENREQIVPETSVERIGKEECTLDSEGVASPRRKTPLLVRSASKETDTQFPLSDNKKEEDTKKEKPPSSSSSGSTCSSTSFAGVAASGEDAAVKPLHDDKEEKSIPLEAGFHPVVGDEALQKKNVEESTIQQQQQQQQQPPVSVAGSAVKKHRPLAIKIALPKRKRPDDEGKRLGDFNVPSAEPATKKTNHGENEETGQTSAEGAAQDVIEYAMKEKPVNTEDVKAPNDNATIADGENKQGEDKEVKVCCYQLFLDDVHDLDTNQKSYLCIVLCLVSFETSSKQC